MLSFYSVGNRQPLSDVKWGTPAWVLEKLHLCCPIWMPHVNRASVTVGLNFNFKFKN